VNANKRELIAVHLGEASWTDWGPEQDRKTFEVLDCVIPEEKPDLIVLSGDQLTANDVRLNATSYYSLLGQHLSRFGIPWCLIFGNHDDQAFEIRLPNGTIIKEPAETSRAELLAVDQGFPLSLTQAGPKTVFGSSNYALDVHYPSAWENHAERTRPEPNGLVAMQLIFLDSGGGSLPQQLQQNQIDWFRRIYRNDTAAAAAFQHIPTYDFAYDGSLCHGMQKDPVDSVSKDPGIVHTLQQAGNVMWLGVGHNHGNDYCCRVNRTGLEPMPSSSRQMLALCFGRHSGYGGYNRGWDRGARIYQVFLRRNVTQQSVTTEWNSWARLESGEIIDRYAPV